MNTMTTGALLRDLAADAPRPLAHRALRLAHDLELHPTRRLENRAADLMALICSIDMEPGAEPDDAELLDLAFDA